MALGFGLLHGLGFASALSEADVTRPELPFALLGFNLGVELGQLVFVACALAAGGLLARFLRQSSRRLAAVAHYSLGGLAMYWFIARIWAFAAL